MTGTTCIHSKIPIFFSTGVYTHGGFKGNLVDF